jgi:hypothetical protein
MSQLHKRQRREPSGDVPDIHIKRNQTTQALNPVSEPVVRVRRSLIEDQLHLLGLLTLLLCLVSCAGLLYCAYQSYERQLMELVAVYVALIVVVIWGCVFTFTLIAYMREITAK